jgi:hypothetical protein
MATSRAHDHAEQRTDGQLRAVGQPRLDRRPRPRVHPNLAAAIALAVFDQNRPAARIEVGLHQ